MRCHFHLAETDAMIALHWDVSGASRLALCCLLVIAWVDTVGAQDRLVSGHKLSGVVADIAGDPIPFAFVALANGASVVADGRGRFTTMLPRGVERVSVLVRRIGFRPADTVLAIAGDDRVHTIVLAPIGALLDTVRIDAASGYDEFLDRSGYYRRLANKVDGTFISYDQIERRNATEVSAVLRDVPGVRVRSGGGRAGRNNLVLGRGGLCALGLVIDGKRVEIETPPKESFQPRITSMQGGPRGSATMPRGMPGAGTLDELVPVSMIAAIEVYPSATSVPNSLQHHVDACGLIVVWTRYQ